MDYVVVFVTCPDRDVGKKIAKALVKDKFAACVNIVDGLSSTYYWQGKIVEDNEVLLIIKTREDHYEKLEKFIKEIHPYTVPEIIAMPIIKGSQDYLNWIDETLSR